MSFLIDDILKKEPCKDASAEHHETKLDSRVNLWPKVNLNDHDSILQQTLLNRSTSEAKQVSEYCSRIDQQCWHSCEKMYLPPSCYDTYLDKTHPYTSYYTRSRFWPSYASSFPVMLPFPYTHYTKRKGGQVRFTASQTDALEKRFNSHKYLSPEDRRILADSLKLTDRQVKTWFQNRRAKWRRCNNSSLNNADTSYENPDDSESDTEICDTSHTSEDKSNFL